MTEADPTQLWYCMLCDQEWDFYERKMKICPDCTSHGVRKDDLGGTGRPEPK